MSNTGSWIAATVVVIVLAALFTVGCGALVSDRGQAVHALEAQGFTSVKITGRNIWAVELFGGCSHNDVVAFTLQGVNPRGQLIKNITVCEGIFKKATVRY